MRRHWHVALTGAIVAWPLAAGAQQNIPESLYRPDTPPVLQAESTAVFRNRGGTIAQFASVYGTKGRPRIAVFWNRRFDDRLSDWTTGLRVTATESTELDVAANGERVDGEKTSSALSGRLDADLKERRTVEASWRLPEQQRGGLPEGLAFQLESGFTATFAEANVAMVDRAAAMRLQDRTVRTSDPDTQRVETDALSSHADLLLEVLMAPQPAAPLGMVFQVNVKDVRTGQVVHSLTSDGQAASEAAAGRWETGEHGFVRASNRAEIASRIGEELALETMAALAGRWR
jgi:hypothetical protein